MNLLAIALLFSLSVAALAADDHRYVPETDPLVLQRLEEWKDLKFGLLMHWGTYSQWGVVESWSICAEDEGWCARKSDNYEAYKHTYEGLKKTFNPVQFDPVRWAAAAKRAGMKYVVFTTKHHDGFCMFDTKQTSYKITDPECPYSKNPKADVTRAVFDSFRSEGFRVGAYFSKPDWHSEDYWWPNFATPDRNPNYDIKRYPERWERFVRFTQAQLHELTSQYGRVDILWLDGGWVKKRTPEEIRQVITSPDYKFTREQNQDIRMDEIVRTARADQPGIIVVDREVPGKNQNYLTPENRVPTEYLPYPWESCIPCGSGWSWSPNAQYMKPEQVIAMLVEIVARGGNLLLNVAPGPDGAWDAGAYALLERVGAWMATNGEAIYGTRALAPYKVGNLHYTQRGDDRYVIYIPGEEKIPAVLELKSVSLPQSAHVSLLGAPGTLTWKPGGAGILVDIPDAIRQNPPSHYGLAFHLR